MPRRPAVPGQDRRQQILEAAAEEFAAEGYDAATTKAIAQRADVTQGLIYFYFPSKEDLFLATHEYQMGKVFAHLTFAAEEISDDPPEIVVRHIVQRFVEVMDDTRSVTLMRLMMRVEFTTKAQSEKRKPTKPIHDIVQHLSSAMRVYVERQTTLGRLRKIDHGIVAHVFTSALIATMMRRLHGDTELTDIPRERLIDGLTDLFLYGVVEHDTRQCP